MTQQKVNFSLRVEEHGKIAVAFLEGFLDESAGQELITAIQAKIDAKFTRFVFDFQKVRNISSPAVAAILDLAEKITDTLSGKLLISGLSELNLKIFEMVGVFLYADACPTTQEAEVKASM
jgi:anti-anti-sigma factor